jgi:hypothetical protein
VAHEGGADWPGRHGRCSGSCSSSPGVGRRGFGRQAHADARGEGEDGSACRVGEDRAGGRAPAANSAAWSQVQCQ